MYSKFEVSSLSNPYLTKELAVIITTKDRPNGVRKLLKSICELDCEVGQIVVVSSGLDISEVVMDFSNNIPIEYYKSEPGQIRQRNKAIEKIKECIRLVACIDDDIILHKDSISEMISFWNRIEYRTAGVGFNITNLTANKINWLNLLGYSSNLPGKVLKCGNNTSISNVNQNIRTEWLTGGSTVWRKEILVNFKHKEITSAWAIGEDLIYSYPIGQKFPLYVCFSAKLDVKEVEFLNLTAKLHIYRGKAQFLWGLYFILSNDNLSLLHYIFYKTMESCSKIIKAVVLREYYKIYNVVGIIIGIKYTIILFLLNELFPEKIKNLIEDNG